MSEVSESEGYLYELPAGWIAPVRELILTMKKLDPDVRIIQTKEKWGSLRVYFSTEKSDAVATSLDMLVVACEVECDSTCQYCGSTKDVELTGVDSGWVIRRCGECANRTIHELMIIDSELRGYNA